MSKKLILITVAATLATTGVAGALVAAAVVYGGIYNVASTEQHLQPVYSVLEIAMRQSVRLRARDIEAPPLHDPRLLAAGAACFRDKCVQCHGAPGVAQGDLGKSTQPLPGPLVDATQRWAPRELYWLTRHGIKMSGMPAWEYRLSEQEIWSIVGFLQQLPDLNAPQYAALSAAAPAAPSCGIAPRIDPPQVVGDVQRGRRALNQFACNACHLIPGVTGSRTDVGPPLRGIAGRSLIAGVLPNTPENMAHWLRETQRVKPGTAMPQLGVGAQDAADIAAYLATLH